MNFCVHKAFCLLFIKLTYSHLYKHMLYKKLGNVMLVDIIVKINRAVNSVVWGPAALIALLCIGIFFSFRLGFLQITKFKLWWNETVGSLFTTKNKKTEHGKITPFRAMATALAGAIGTGNIVGVATAITLGGAGAIFWMWISSIFGMATIFAENVLGVLYREKRDEKFVGGPMYYIKNGLHCKWLSAVFAVSCTLASLGMGNMTQSNSVAGALYVGFDVSPTVTGAFLTGLVGIVIFGGIERISSFTSKIVPIMAVLYTFGALVVVFVNIKKVPEAFGEIFSSAFDINAAAGGFMGYGMSRALKYGISRGVFSNEAGLGSSPIVHAAADTDEPCKQGMWGIFQVFIDTIVLCTLMALCILCTGAHESGVDGIALSSLCFENVFGDLGKYFMTLSITLFGVATLVSWSYFGERSVEYLTNGRFIKSYRIAYTLITFVGCVLNLNLVWEISDTFNGLMAIPNMIAIVLLSGVVKKEYDRYIGKTR